MLGNNRKSIGFVNSVYNSKGIVLDPSTIAFITAAGITDPTQINAINRLVLNYKGQGNLNNSVDLWTGSNAIYPIVGGSATSHMYNLKDPRNLDAAFRLAFSGGWTHDSNGMTSNGTNAFANTFLKPSDISLNSIRGVSYNRTNNTLSGYRNLFGSTNAAFTSSLSIDSGANLSTKRYWANAFNNEDNTVATILGLNAVIRTASNVVGGFRNTTKTMTSTRSSVSANSLNIYIAANNLNNVVQANTYLDSNFAFVDFGSGISDTNYLLLNSIILQFQTDLGRNV
jgi:hypothetical protein